MLLQPACTANATIPRAGGPLQLFLQAVDCEMQGPKSQQGPLSRSNACKRFFSTHPITSHGVHPKEITNFMLDELTQEPTTSSHSNVVFQLFSRQCGTHLSVVINQHRNE